MITIKKAGNKAVRVNIFESLSPHRCMKIAAIIMNLGIAIPTSMKRVTVSENSRPTAATSMAVRTISPIKLNVRSFFHLNKDRRMGILLPISNQQSASKVRNTLLILRFVEYILQSMLSMSCMLIL